MLAHRPAPRLRRPGRLRPRSGDGPARRVLDGLVFALVFLAVFDPGHAALAYLDPGTGSIILQTLLGALAGAAVVAKLYWHRLTLFLRRGRRDAGTTPPRP